MTKNKVNIMPDEHGNKIRVSTNNPEFGYIRLHTKYNKLLVLIIGLKNNQEVH